MRRLLCAAVGLLLAPALALYSPSSPVVQLDDSNFKDTVLRDDAVWIVEFFAPWCGHCKSLTPEYEKAASLLKGVVKLGAVDATASQKLAQKYGVQGYPTIKVFGADKRAPTDYAGPRTTDAIVTDAMATARRMVKDRQTGKAKGGAGGSQGGGRGGGSGPIVELTSANFDELVLNSPEQWIVKFVAPWCGHCKNLQPEWEIAAANLSGTVMTGSVDCTQYEDLAQRYDVKGFPTIKIFPHGSKHAPIPYNGERSAGAIAAEATRILEESGYVPTLPVPQITSQKVLDETCGGAQRICVISVLPHIADGGAAAREAHIETIKAAAKKARNHMFSYLWTEVGAQPNLEQALSLTFGTPAAVAISKDKGVYAVHVGAFDEANIASFVQGVVSRVIKTRSIASLPPVETIQEWDGKDAPVVEEEFSLEELMAEEL
ncbi:protein disulfide isomerase family [Tribonema minus]|uniref:protein disulfide-isomerase n=1 Tax=Tribonema minus TaxID=303371 RepID=A0A835YTP9_9STRA|nr:protein disulfide isomerase family [Tribonema minus]